MSLASSLETLANYRAHSSRESQDVFEKGVEIVNSGKASRLGDEGTLQLSLRLTRLSSSRVNVRMGF